MMIVALRQLIDRITSQTLLCPSMTSLDHLNSKFELINKEIDSLRKERDQLREKGLCSRTR